MWSNSVSQADEQPRLAKYAADLGFKRVAVLYLNTDWGRSSQTIFTEAAKAYGVEVVAAEGYQPDEKDFRSTLVRVRDAKPDAIVLISYYADGALITRQIRIGRPDARRSSPAVRSIRRSSSSSPATPAKASSPNRISSPATRAPKSRPS